MPTPDRRSIHGHAVPLSLRRAGAYPALRGAPGALWLIGVLIATFTGVTIGTFLPRAPSAAGADGAVQAAAAPAPYNDLERSLRQIVADEERFDGAAMATPPAPVHAGISHPADAGAASEAGDIAFPDAPDIDVPPVAPLGERLSTGSVIKIAPAGTGGAAAGATATRRPAACSERPSAAGTTTICIRPRD